jgi:parvulin-like peptidyl-prolyl isomerase
MQERLLIGKAMAALSQKGESQSQDPKYMRKRFEEHPEEFDGTTVSARHIQKTVFPYDTLADREQKRAELAKIREDIVSGKVKWNDAVQQSDCRSRLNGGNLGAFTRHIMITEPVAEAAFNMKVGELSEIVESDLGFHIIEVLARQPGNRKFEDNETQKELRHWFEFEPLQLAMREARNKYPVIGVEPPSDPPPAVRLAASAPADAKPSTQPVRRSKSRFPENNPSKDKKQTPIRIKPLK